MGETALAKQLLKLVGGKQNINQVWHCATRLRFTLKDQDKVPKEKVEALDGVITVVEASGQFQVVIGNNVSDVYQEVVKLEPSLSDGTEGPATVTHEKMTFKRAFNGLLTFISGVFTPILGCNGRCRDPEGPVIASGGAWLADDEKRGLSDLVGRGRWHFLFSAVSLGVYGCQTVESQSICCDGDCSGDGLSQHRGVSRQAEYRLFRHSGGGCQLYGNRAANFAGGRGAEVFGAIFQQDLA